MLTVQQCLLKTLLGCILFLGATSIAHASHFSCGDTPTGVVTYDNSSYCELCGTGVVTIIVTNTSRGEMSDFSVSHDFLSTDLEYVSDSTTYRINGGGPTLGGGNPTITAGGSLLTWDSGDVAALASIDGGNSHDPNNFDTVEISFEVRSVSGTEEDLVSANRNVQANVAYTFCQGTVDQAARIDNSGPELLDLREPFPGITKRGRNVDAAQGTGSYSTPVYGNINDDVIWRIQIRNTGLADMQDLKFDDIMGGTNFDINFVCPSEGDATAIANNDGADPGGTNCNTESNTINDFLVDNPFGETGVSADGFEIDVAANDSTFIYLVGKVLNSCDANSTNSVSNVEWGCETIAPDGGITSPSTGGIPADTATFSSFSNINNLNVVTRITGLNGSQPVGSRGLVRVTITNNTGGSVKNIVLDNKLPAEYVVDPTFDPTLNVNRAYGNYAGAIDTVVWQNPAPNTYPNLTSIDPLEPLANTDPVFSLTSNGVSNPDYADQINMLRHGDVAVLTFRIVMIPPDSYDLDANIDVRTEVFDIIPADSTDPDNSATLTHELRVDFDDFCTGARTLPAYPQITNHTAFPEDLDVDITGPELIFILTNDPALPLPLQVSLTNNGGHSADDYFAYVSFGATMDVSTVAGGCALTTSPPPREVWDDPADVPANATTYECTGPAIGPGQTRNLNFEVIKSSDAADLAADDLSFRADVIGEIQLADNTPLWFPTVDTNPIVNSANNYSFDSVRARVIGFNLLKTQVGNCSENNPPPASPDNLVQIGEECSFNIRTGGWFGFLTPGFTYIAVQRVSVTDELPDGQAWISSTDPNLTSDIGAGKLQSIVLTADTNPPLQPLDEGWFTWSFNQNVATERITIADQWFEANVTTRLLNDPVDNIAAPNLHAAASTNVLNSIFQAVFFNDVISAEEVFDLGQATLGYPQEVVRRIDLTVTEPNISLNKQVCNETLYGVGTACTNFVVLADDGDTQDSYIYRVTISNEAAASGVQRAPAYNITSTDILDASDLMYIEPFDSDGLDNDGDGLIDGADGDGESFITDNIVENLTPANIITSHTHSDALLQIDAGASVTFYYRVDPDDTAAPLQELTNSISATYDSLEGDSGNQTVILGTNSTAGGARVYTSAAVTATAQMLGLVTQPKRIINLSNTPAIGGQPQPVSVGEEVEYELLANIPIANLRDFYISDTLPDGISCSEAPVVDLDASPYDAAGFVPGGQITPTCTDSLVYWDFGDQELTTAPDATARFDFYVRFIARVDNSATNNNAVTLSNGNPATNTFLHYVDEASVDVTLNFTQHDILVQEPNIVLTKAFESASNDAGDIITVTVTATNTGTANAYNLQVLDDLTAKELTFIDNTGGADLPDVIDTTTFGANQPLFSWDPLNPNYSIAPAATITFTFDISIDGTVQPDEILDNILQASWTSLPDQSTALNSSGLIGADGSVTGMRNGLIPNAGDLINDHETTATTFTTVPPLTLLKTDLTPALIAEIGAQKVFQVTINLPEGITNNVVVTDYLNFSGTGSYVLENNASFDVTYTFNDIATINGLAADEAVFNAFPADGSSNAIIWDIGTVVTNSEDDTLGVPAINPGIVINYYARINNDVSTDAGDVLQNSVDVNYDHGETGVPVTLNANTPAITVVEPVILAVTKLLTPITPAPITGGDILQYAVSVTNTGTATAYDINITDSLPLELLFDSGYTPVAAIDGVPVATFISTPAGVPGGPLIWGQGNSGDGSLDLLAGSTLALTYQVIVSGNAQANASFINSVTVDWTSLDGPNSRERTGAGCPTITAPNDYCVGPATVTSDVTDTNTFTKTFLSDTYVDASSTALDGIVRIGDIVTYQLALNLQEGLARAVTVQDVLPAGLAFLDIVSINGDTVADYSAPVLGSGSNFSYSAIPSSSLPVQGQSGAVNFNLGNIINDPLGDATTDTLIIEYRAQVQGNILALAPTTTLTNIATLYYIDALGVPVVDPVRLESSADIIVWQPILTLEKTGPPVMRVGEAGSFTLNVHNIGTAAAWDLTINDLLPNIATGGMCDVPPGNITAQIMLADGVTPVGAPLIENTDFIVTVTSGSPACDFEITMQSAAAALPVDYRLIIGYDVYLDTDTAADANLTNLAGATEWFSADTNVAGPAIPTSTYSYAITDGTPGTLDHEDAYTVTTEAPVIQFQKYVTNITSGDDPGTLANPGDVLRYRIVATNVSPLTVPGFSITDELDALNASVMFTPGSLSIVSTPVGADTSNTSATGGAKASGLLDIRNLVLDPQGGANDTVTVEFDVTLAPVITSGTVVLNQAYLQTPGVNQTPSDDPNTNGADDPAVIGDEDPTPILIDSWPLFQIYKTSDDITGSPAELMAGDTLRYTIRVKNIGSENAVAATLTDQIPANTTYVADSTRLNGLVIADPALNTSALQAGLLINAPENPAPGYLRADSGVTVTTNIATITFDVVIDADVVDGTILTNQAWLNADGAGISGSVPLQPSDDPDTVILDDPTRDVVGNVPLIDSQKTVAIAVDNGTPGFVDPGDVLRYTITVTNYGAIPATGVQLLDAVPTDTTYVEDSVYLNGLPVGQPDAAVSPLIAGIDISSADLTPPVPEAGVGYLSPGATATITFDVYVDLTVAIGTVISNQGFVYSNELPVEPTDADGIDANGDQPTLIVVGNAQQLSITKQVALVAANAALAGGMLEYQVVVRNISTVPATDVVIYDNLDLPVPAQMTFVAGSATLNGLPAGVSFLAPTLTGDYSTTYGLLMPGQTVTLIFRVLLDPTLAIGTTITNTAQVYWNAMTQTAAASVSIDIGGTPGSANLNGRIWHDSNFDDIFDSGERTFSNWRVDTFFKGKLIGSVQTNDEGIYHINGLAPNYIGDDRYELRYVAAGAGPGTAKLGEASSIFVNGLHYIADIVVLNGNNLQNLNLPIEPNGVVYDSIVRVPVSGATVTLLRAATNLPLPPDCFDDPVQQNQVTPAEGYYKFDINFNEPECGPGDDYIITVSPSTDDHLDRISVAIPPLTSASTPAFAVPACLGSINDAVPVTANHCEVQTFTTAPPLSIAPRTAATNYHLHLTLNDGQLPGESQLFNNHISIDPNLGQAVSISKVANRINVSRGEIVPYTILVKNNLPVPLTDISIIDNFPPGFKYIAGSGRINDIGAEPVLVGPQLVWDVDQIEFDTTYKLELLLIAGSGVQEGEYVNRAYVISNDLLGNNNTSGIATATVRVVPDPLFDCSDVIGKVFDDKNLNGRQDEGESGVPDVRLATTRGLLITTDKNGRFHVTCATVPNEQRGSNFVLKIDERSLPTGYRITTENPRVMRLTRGKISQFNFGVTVHRVVTLDVADGVFERESGTMRQQWIHRIGLLMEQLGKKASVLRINYLADVEGENLVTERIEKLKDQIFKHWEKVNSYKLMIETEVYWRHGGPVSDGGFD